MSFNVWFVYQVFSLQWKNLKFKHVLDPTCIISKYSFSNLGSISPTFYKQFLHKQIPIVQKDTDNLIVVLRFCDQCMQKLLINMLVKFTLVLGGGFVEKQINLEDDSQFLLSLFMLNDVQ